MAVTCEAGVATSRKITVKAPTKRRPASVAEGPAPLLQEVGEPGPLHLVEVADQPVLVGHVCPERPVDDVEARVRERDDPAAGVVLADPAGDPALLDTAVDPLGDRARRHHRLRAELAGGELVRRPGPPQRREHVELALAEPVLAVDGDQLLGQRRREAVQAPDDPLRRDVEVGPLDGPLGHDPSDVVGLGHSTSPLSSRRDRSMSAECSSRTTTTGQAACRTHWSLTEPRARPRNPPSPRAPITSRSASCDASTRPLAGAPR